MKYYVSRGLRFTVTKEFVNIEDPDKNLQDCNSYLETKNGEEGVLWSSVDNSMIIIARNDDRGTPLAET